MRHSFIIIAALMASIIAATWMPIDAKKKIKKSPTTTKVATTQADTTAQAPADTTAQAPIDTLAWLKAQDKEGNLDATFALGMVYYQGEYGEKQDFNTAATCFAKAADKGHPQATTMLATCYLMGNGVEKDMEKARKLYMIAIKKGDNSLIDILTPLAEQQGSLFASQLLAECYSKGIGVKVDKAKSMHFTEIAANAGDIESCLTTGLTYYNKKERDKAFPFFEKAALAGDTQATYFYGLMLFDGDGVTQDRAKGIKYLQLAADSSHVAANAKLGYIYFNGDGMTQDKVKGFNMIKRAAELGNNKAQWTLANCYRTGDGVNQDYSLAAHWLAQVATGSRKGDYATMIEDLKAKNDPFYSYLKGLHAYYVAGDYEAAQQLFKAVEKAKNPEGLTMQAVCLTSKKNPKLDLKKAAKLFEKASSSSPTACYYLAYMLETGNGVKKDEARALQLLTKAADGGNGDAQCRLADKYIKGSGGVSMDLEKAAHYYVLAEAQHALTPDAAKQLANLYENDFMSLPSVPDVKKHAAELRKTKENNNLLNMLATTKF